MNLNLKNILNGTPVRLRYVFRYSTSRVQHPESVAEHSYYVALYSMCICDWVFGQVTQEWFDANIQPSLLMRRALVHDLEEARSGDFPRPFKHSDPKLREILEHAAEEAMKDVAEEISDNQVYQGWILKLWKKAKHTDYEGRILEFADFLSVLSFMLQEKDSGGNRSIGTHVKDMDKYFEKFLTPEYDFIRPIVTQAAEIMQELFHGQQQA